MKIRFNQANIDGIEEAAIEALVDTGEAIKTDLIQSQTMPFDTGTMQNRSTFVDDKKKRKRIVRIVSDTPYARKVYFDPEIHIKQVENPNAKQHWFDDYIEGNKKDLPMEYYAKLLKRRMES